MACVTAHVLLVVVYGRGKSKGMGDAMLMGWERPSRSEQRKEKKAVAAAATTKKVFRGKVMR